MIRKKDIGKKGKIIIYYKKKTKAWDQRASIALFDLFKLTLGFQANITELLSLNYLQCMVRIGNRVSH